MKSQKTTNYYKLLKQKTNVFGPDLTIKQKQNKKKTNSIWHVGMSYGLSLLLIYLTYLECVLRGHLVFFAPASKVYFSSAYKYKCNCKEIAKHAIEEIKEVQSMKLKKLWMPVLFVNHPCAEVSSEILSLTHVDENAQEHGKQSGDDAAAAAAVDAVAGATGVVVAASDNEKDGKSNDTTDALMHAVTVE